MYWFLVLRSDLEAERGDVEAVKGLRIGAAPGVDLGLKRMLAAAGLDPEADNIQIQPVPGATAPGASFWRDRRQGPVRGPHRRLLGQRHGRGGGGPARRRHHRAGHPARRRDPPKPGGYTFPALITSDRVIADDPDAAAAAVRALVKTQRALAENPQRAAEVGKALYPAEEAGIIATLIERDVPYYDPRDSGTGGGEHEPLRAGYRPAGRAGRLRGRGGGAVQSHLWEGS